MIKYKKIWNDGILAFSSLLGMGVKLGPVPVLDEIGLFCSSVMQLRYPIKFRVDIYTVTLFYFALIYSVGFIISKNVNALRYIAIGLLLALYGTLKPSLFARKSILAAAIAYLFLGTLIPLIGFHYGFEIAWWQQGIWTGTAYSSIGIFVSSLLIVTLTRNNFYNFLAIALMYSVGILTDSRYTIILILIVLIIYLMKNTYEQSVGKFIQNIAGFIFSLVLFIQVLSYATEVERSDYYDLQLSQVSSITSTLLSVVSDETTRDEDRKSMNAAVFKLTAEKPLHAFWGSGGLSHQLDMTNYIQASQDGRVRPVGFPAIVFDGGWVFFILIVICCSKTVVGIKRRYRASPWFLKIAAISLPLVAFMSVFVTNTLDSVLFWLMISPVGVPSFLVESWHSMCPQE